jgi:hypothetical protein
MAGSFAKGTAGSTWPLLVAVFTLAGLYVAVEEALEALTAGFIPAETRGLAYGAPGTVNGVGDFASSATVGFLWTTVSPVLGFGLAATVMVVGTVMLWRLHD